jgi:flagellar basal body rod protein FlgF
VDTENAWHSYEMVEGSEKISVVNAEGETVIPGRPLISLTMDKDGYLIMESEEGAGAMDRSGKLLCWYSRAGEAIPPQNDGEE